jgi:flavin-dependent dehydrogenase
MLLATAFIFAAPLRAPSSNWTLVEACASGWWYSAPLPRNESSIMFFTDRDSAHRRATDVQELAALTGARLTIDRIPHRAPVQVCRRVAALGCAAQENGLCIPIGDAALALDPLSGSGLYVAVDTGITAADAVWAAANGQMEKIGEYRDGTRRTFSAHLAARAHVYAAEGRWLDHPFWQRRSGGNTTDTRHVAAATW